MRFCKFCSQYKSVIPGAAETSSRDVVPVGKSDSHAVVAASTGGNQVKPQICTRGGSICHYVAQEQQHKLLERQKDNVGVMR
jgi:hypothetical protein